MKKALIFEKISAFGGDKRDRTADLLNAIQALSQLSYTPIEFVRQPRWPANNEYYSRIEGKSQALF